MSSSPSASSEPGAKLTSPASPAPVRVNVVLLYAYLLVALGVSIAAVLVVWPSTAEFEIVARISAEMRQLLLVIAGAILGSSLTALRSVAVHTTDPTRFKRSLWAYTLDVMVAAPLALTLYMAIRGFILSPVAGAQHLNASGVLCLSVVVGIWGPDWIFKITPLVGSRLVKASAMEDRLDQITSALGISTLDNYRGNVCLLLADMAGNVLPRTEEGSYVMSAGTLYKMTVWFVPTIPDAVLSQRVEISGGTDVSTIQFGLSVDSDLGKLDRRGDSVSFGVTARSPDVSFTFSSQRSAGNGRVWVEVLQKNRLVEVLAAELTLRSENFTPSPNSK